MAHRTSASGLHTARMVLMHNNLTVKLEQPYKGLTNSDAHLSIIIDNATQAHVVADLRPEFYVWQDRLWNNLATADQLAEFLKRLIEAVEAIPHDPPTQETPTFGGRFPVHQWSSIRMRPLPISKAGLEASRWIFNFYDVVAKDHPEIADDMLRVMIAKLCDVSLGLRKISQYLKFLKEVYGRLLNRDIYKDEVLDIFEAVGVVIEKLPNFHDRREEGKLLV